MSLGATDGPAPPNPVASIEYSSREVCPPALLLRKIQQAHSLFCLHHGPSINELFARHSRSEFCSLLDGFWTRFAETWDVLLHGNPSVDIFAGIKLAAGGELGIGVGEEEWGSGEREVFEHLVAKTDGLVDLVVSRFGEVSSEQLTDAERPKRGAFAKDEKLKVRPWMGRGTLPSAPDGVVFSGTGAVSRHSVRAVSDWMQCMYTFGDYAFGVRDDFENEKPKRRNVKSPESTVVLDSSGSDHIRERRFKPSRGLSTQQDESDGTPDRGMRPGIPPPIIFAAERSLETATLAAATSHSGAARNKQTKTEISSDGNDYWPRYLTLGYGSSWGKVKKRPLRENTMKRSGETKINDHTIEQSDQLLPQHSQPSHEKQRVYRQEKLQILRSRENNGYFMVGLKDYLESESQLVEAEDDDTATRTSPREWNNRTSPRTIYVQMKDRQQDTSTFTGKSDELRSEGFQNIAIWDSEHLAPTTGVRAVVYVVSQSVEFYGCPYHTESSQHRPFIYTFLFQPEAELLARPSLYRTLHTYLFPLHRPLCSSTSPTRVAPRVLSSHPSSNVPAARASSAPVFDLVYDPVTLTVHSSIPNIPEPWLESTEQGKVDSSGTAEWNRMDALNVHSQILATRADTTWRAAARHERERTVKTARGWWIVWMRLPSPAAADSAGDEGANDAASTKDGNAEYKDGPGANTQFGDNDKESLETEKPLREAFLIRQAHDPTDARGKITGSTHWKQRKGGMFGLMEADATDWGPVKLAEGIGIDARRYVEGLLSLNR